VEAVKFVEAEAQ